MQDSDMLSFDTKLEGRNSCFYEKECKNNNFGNWYGGNDVNMIQEAHIGVGILGKEGN